jgi:hypothetical protein
VAFGSHSVARGERTPRSIAVLDTQRFTTQLSHSLQRELRASLANLRLSQRTGLLPPAPTAQQLLHHRDVLARMVLGVLA